VEKLNNSQTKYYSPDEHFAFEIVVLLEGKVIFKQYILKKHKRFGIKITSSVILRDTGLHAMTAFKQKQMCTSLDDCH
jgi:hypothetical protein